MSDDEIKFAPEIPVSDDVFVESVMKSIGNNFRYYLKRGFHNGEKHGLFIVAHEILPKMVDEYELGSPGQLAIFAAVREVKERFEKMQGT